MVRADEAAPLQARAVGQPKLRAQGLKALHGWLTCGWMSEKPEGPKDDILALLEA